MNIIIITIIMITTFIMANPTAAIAATLSLSPSTGTFNRSCPVSLAVALDTAGAQTDGTDAILSYDASRFSAQSIVNGSIYSDFPGNNINEASGKITISGLASVSSPFSGTGTLATIQFIVKDTAPTGATQIKFDFDPNDKAKTTDSNVVERSTVVDVLNSVTDGNYTIGTGTCAAQSSSAPSPSPSAVVVTTPRGAPEVTATSSASLKSLPPALPPAGSEQLTFTLAIVGSILTVLGVLGLVLL